MVTEALFVLQNSLDRWLLGENNIDKERFINIRLYVLRDYYGLSYEKAA